MTVSSAKGILNRLAQGKPDVIVAELGDGILGEYGVQDILADKELSGAGAAWVMDPSLRTRASFEAAMFLHGGHGIVLEPGKGSWSLETEPGAVMDGTTVEHIKDAARVLGRYADALGVRTFPRPGNWDTVRQDLVIKRFAEYCEKPIINLESTRRHPCQGLADAMRSRQSCRVAITGTSSSSRRR